MSRQILTTILALIRSVIFEILVVCVLLLTFYNYIGIADTHIGADGEGYYEYLPSVFIHKDINRKDSDPKKNPELFARTGSMGVYADLDSITRVNKYPCGTALLQSPFFFYTRLATPSDGTNRDGYQQPYQDAVFYSAIFYLFLSLWFLKKLLLRYEIKPYIIVLLQLFLALATSVTNYVHQDAAFSHVYSLFAITAFFYCVKSYFSGYRASHLIWAFVLLGLIIILRNVNVLVILFIPFLAGSGGNLKAGVLATFRNFKALFSGMALTVAIISIQCISWYLQTGKFFVYSYPGEGFNFSDPHFSDILFSYRKGLFIYAPVLFISLFGLISLLREREFYLFFSWICFFLILTYVLSSWHSWYYGGSFGLRAYIDFYAIFFVLFALLLNRSRRWVQGIILIPALITIPLNLVQNYQYRNYILHWFNMNETNYWKVFLHQEKQFEGILWKREFNYDYYDNVKEITIDKAELGKDTLKQFYEIHSSDIPGFHKVSIIRISLENDFDEALDGKLEVFITDSVSGLFTYTYSPTLLHFADGPLNQYGTGTYPCEIPDNTYDTATGQQSLRFRVQSGRSRTKVALKNIKISFLVLKS
ncbi:MAG: hypothetical protein FD123_4014 [Bacteroidetes bacterium]|nr:MAG: hypothetical protein FD123_4014 [Bacteroidota bacterium]